MDPIAPGIRLQASPLLDGSFFEKAELLIYACDDKGATGFVTNRKFHRRLNELLEFSHSKPLEIYDGGPVDREHLYFLHRRPDMIPGGTAVKGEIYFGGDFAVAVALVNEGRISETDIRIYLGYCGWDAGELEAEIAEGSWKLSVTDKPLFS